MPRFADALRALNDLDVLVFLPVPARALVSLDSIYRWAEANGYPAQDEHVIVEGVPTQFVPAPNELADEAITSAEELDYEGVRVRVVRPEHQMASKSEREPSVSPARPRPSPELLQKLRAGKAALRLRRSSLPLADKVRQLLELQRLQFPLLVRQRPLRCWERPWDVEP